MFIRVGGVKKSSFVQFVEQSVSVKDTPDYWGVVGQLMEKFLADNLISAEELYHQAKTKEIPEEGRDDTGKVLLKNVVKEFTCSTTFSFAKNSNGVFLKKITGKHFHGVYIDVLKIVFEDLFNKFKTAGNFEGLKLDLFPDSGVPMSELLYDPRYDF